MAPAWGYHPMVSRRVKRFQSLSTGRPEYSTTTEAVPPDGGAWGRITVSSPPLRR